MIESVHFKNFKALRDTTLPLHRFTLIVGPNGSGKTTALQALSDTSKGNFEVQSIITAGVPVGDPQGVAAEIRWGNPYKDLKTKCQWRPGDCMIECFRGPAALPPKDRQSLAIRHLLATFTLYSFDARAISPPCQLQPQAKLGEDGAGLAVVLDRLRDEEPERFESLNAELGRCLPEFDRILFDTPKPGFRSFKLRQRQGGHQIPAGDLSQGSLIALAILTLAYLPDPPAIIGLEEPDRGIHPRLLRDIRDALYRLSYPEQYGEKREPVQVIATTHSPYFLDLFRDHPEEIVIANKINDNVQFQRLTDHPDIAEILGDASLGDVWYTGILGGVPCER